MGDYIIKEGEKGETFYIIEEGAVECLKTEEKEEGEEGVQFNNKVHVRDLTVGDHFGELALIKDTTRSLSVRVKSEQCKVLALGRDAFQRILGDINKYLKKDYDGVFDK